MITSKVFLSVIEVVATVTVYVPLSYNAVFFNIKVACPSFFEALLSGLSSPPRVNLRYNNVPLLFLHNTTTLPVKLYVTLSTNVSPKVT